MHILFLTDNFPPEVNAPASRTFEHCKEWCASGDRVTVITCAPNFPQGRVYEGYSNKLWQTEVRDGITIIRVWSYITANSGFAKRVLDYLSFMVAAILAAMFVRRVDVVVGTSPQFFTACAACVVGFYKRRPWVFEVRDIWPESIKVVGAMRESLALRLLERLELFLYRSAARVVVVTHSFRTSLGSRGVDVSKIDVVTNGVDLSQFVPAEKPQDLVQLHGLEGRFVAGYIGTHGLAHGLNTLLDAAKLLQDMPEAQNVHLLFLGHGAEKAGLIQRSQELGLRNVLFLDSVPKQEVVRYWSLLDVSIIHLRKAELFGSVIPSKLFECMGMGLPVLHGVMGESAEIVRREAVGCVFESENAMELAQGLLRMRKDADAYAMYRANALRAAKRYDRKYLARCMLDVLHKFKGT